MDTAVYDGVMADNMDMEIIGAWLSAALPGDYLAPFSVRSAAGRR